MNLNGIPSMHENSIDHIRWLIGMIEGFDLTEDPAVLNNFVGNLLNQVPQLHFLLQIPDEEFDPTNPEHINGCFRTRPDSFEKVTEEKHLWARNKESVNSFGRCHGPNQEILYCSNNMIVNFAELGLKGGDVCVTARFVSKKPIEPINMVMLGDNRYKFESSIKFNPADVPRLDSLLSKKNKEKLKAIEKFIMRHFQKWVPSHSDHKYKITAAIAKMYFNEPSNRFGVETRDAVELCGILYPSVKADLKSYNLAFRNDIAQKHMEITHVYGIKIVSVQNNKYTISYTHQVVDQTSDGRLIWEAVGSV